MQTVFSDKERIPKSYQISDQQIKFHNVALMLTDFKYIDTYTILYVAFSLLYISMLTTWSIFVDIRRQLPDISKTVPGFDKPFRACLGKCYYTFARNGSSTLQAFFHSPGDGIQSPIK
uniref:Uncharacterized protein n=1 Tax=Glossina brevipalpis TaxID=37001 RepID=A0A1A9X138_9MUSC